MIELVYKHILQEYIADKANKQRIIIKKMYGSKMTITNDFAIKNVIFYNHTTIVFRKDRTKTIVKSTEEPFDSEKGLAMAISKKVLVTNKSSSNYYNEFKRWLPEETPNFYPCTPLGIIEFLKYQYTKQGFYDKNIVIIGRGKTVGEPLVIMIYKNLKSIIPLGQIVLVN